MSKVAVLEKKVKQPEGEEFDLSDVLAGASAPKPSKSKKSSVPVLEVGEDVKKLAGRVREVKEQLDSAESMYETLGAELVQKVAPLREDLCRRSYLSSVRVPDSKGLSVGISWADKYKAIPRRTSPRFGKSPARPTMTTSPRASRSRSAISPRTA